MKNNVKEYVKIEELLKELLAKQLKNMTNDKKLQYTDLYRICKYIKSSMFDEENCCIWDGYITNSNNSKGTYINFYFKKKKAALHRLLYMNFIGDLSDDEYLKFNCENKGKCCNINHLAKYKYKTKEDIDNDKNIQLHKKNDKKKDKHRIKIINIDADINNSKMLTLSFD